MKQIKPLVIAFICTTFFLMAQAGNGNKGNHNGQNKDHGKEGKRVPIDGGLSLLFAAGVGYGVKKISDKKKNKALSSQM